MVDRLPRALRRLIPAHLRRRFGAERGAVMLLAGVAMVGVIASTAIAVDIGHAVDFKRDLQSDADLAALDAVRALGDRKGEGGLAPQVHAEKLAEESLGRNGFDTDAAGNTWSVVLGNMDSNRTFVPAVDLNTAEAVKVLLESPIEWSFQPGGRSYNAEGVAEILTGPGGGGGGGGGGDTETGGVAGIAVGSWLANLDTSKSSILNGVLGGFLGGAVNLSLVSYQGLAAGEVTLRRLGTALNLETGTPDEVLNTDVTLKQLFQAAATALVNQGDAASLAAATPMATLAATASSAIDLQLGELIDVAQGGGSAALDAGINVFQLASMAAQVADNDHFLDVTLPVAVPGVATTTLKLQVIESPRMAIGPAKQENGVWVTSVTTAQIRAQLSLSLLNVLNVLGVAAPVTLPLYIEGGGAQAELQSVTCGPTPATQGAGVYATSQALSARVGQVTQADLIDVTTGVSVQAGTLVNVLGLIRITGTSTVNTTSTSGMLNFTGPWPQTQSNGGSTTLGLSGPLKSNLNLTANALGILPVPLGTVSDLLAILGPVFDVLDASLIDRLMSAVGLSLGGADVTVFHHHCQSRRIAS